MLAADALLEATPTTGSCARSALLRRVFKRIDLTARSLFALIEPGSCFAGFLAELVFAADRAFMFSGTRAGDNRGAAMLTLSPSNFGAFRWATGSPGSRPGFSASRTAWSGRRKYGESLLAEDAEELGLVTAIYDEVDWDEEVRLVLEERASFSPDALTGLEANLRFAGPETMETKIFGRLSAWQNWIFQRPNAVGDEGALKRYGTGLAPPLRPGADLNAGAAHGIDLEGRAPYVPRLARDRS